MQWFQDDDRKTKFFHAHVKGKRKILQVSRILNNNGNWIENQDDMAKEAVEFFKAQFTEDRVIGEDVLNMIKAFFGGAEFPKFITHTNLVILSNKKNVATFSDIRPISLCNFSNNIISNVLHERLVSNNWYSVLLNGQANGFVKSIRGVKQGDILSPTLFMLTGEVLGRALDALFDNSDFIGFVMPKWSHNINYLSYVDDTIIFSQLHYGAIQLIKNVLEDYEAASGEKRHPFLFIYLGCPIFYSRGKKDFYKGIMFNIQERLQSWKGKLLSIGGRAVLIAQVLEGMPIHLVLDVNLPKYVINDLHRMFASFFWSNSENGRARHWAS
ncbi:uncharacterized protein [Nicotiana sylvestris]|uniref:uncharacterized protein n=1 Tax=Nicotiana sylvestris TaxID=4096 RepID=UPI00388CABDE